MPGYPQRSYTLVVPSHDGGQPLPVLLMLHGGGGNRAVAARTACPGGVTTDPGCLDRMAASRGFVVVLADGTGTGPRTWNAGGGRNGWQCVSGPACLAGVDERAYFEALLSELGTAVRFDPTRLFATGHSNGGALAHRLACELNGMRGIAPVAGANQWATTRTCTRQVAVLEIHGSADPCWPFDGGPASCADPNDGAKVSVPATLEGWRANNGCDGGLTRSQLPDTTNDGTVTVRTSWSCAGPPVELYEVQGGGHTWPSGYSFSMNAGPVASDWSANSTMLDFFEAQ